MRLLHHFLQLERWIIPSLARSVLVSLMVIATGHVLIAGDASLVDPQGNPMVVVGGQPWTGQVAQIPYISGSRSGAPITAGFSNSIATFRWLNDSTIDNPIVFVGAHFGTYNDYVRNPETSDPPFHYGTDELYGFPSFNQNSNPPYYAEINSVNFWWDWTSFIAPAPSPDFYIISTVPSYLPISTMVTPINKPLLLNIPPFQQFFDYGDTSNFDSVVGTLYGDVSRSNIGTIYSLNLNYMQISRTPSMDGYRLAPNFDLNFWSGSPNEGVPATVDPVQDIPFSVEFQIVNVPPIIAVAPPFKTFSTTNATPNLQILTPSGDPLLLSITDPDQSTNSLSITTQLLTGYGNYSASAPLYLQNPLAPGYYSEAITATDEMGAATTQTIPFQVIDTPPSITVTGTTIHNPNTDFASVIIFDPDPNDPGFISLSDSSGLLELDPSSDVNTYGLGFAVGVHALPGVYLVFLTATDSYGKSTTVPVTILFNTNENGPRRAGGNPGATDKDPCSHPYGSSSGNGSVIDTVQQSHVHDAIDYQKIAGVNSGCSTCGATSLGVSALPTFTLNRWHRYRDLDHHGSFGPGVFCTYDIGLTLDTANQSIEMWDPARKVAVAYIPSSPGVFIDPDKDLTNNCTLYDINGVVAGDMTQAVQAIVTEHDGSTMTFQIIRTDAIDSGIYRGRLTIMADRNNHQLNIQYSFSDPSISDSAIGYDRSQLWCMSQITDAYGSTASFTYTTDLNNHVIQSVLLPNTQTIIYQYGKNNLIGLSGITYPDGTISTFSTCYDSATQCQIVSYNDSGAAGVHRVKQAYHTTSDWMSTLGVLSNQEPNLCSQIVNGAGEVEYWSRVEETGSILSFYFYEGGSAEGAGEVTRLDTNDGLALASYRATAWDPTTDPSTWTWEIVNNYATDGHGRPSLAIDGLNRPTSYERGPGGVVTQEDSDNPDGSIYAEQTTTYNEFNEPLISIDPLGRETDYTYDSFGNCLTIENAVGTPDLAVHAFSYTPDGQIESAIDADGNTTFYSYDSFNRLVAVTSPPDVEGNPAPVQSMTYDATGRMATSTDEAGRTASYSYDSRNRIIQITYADGTSDITQYGSGSSANLIIATVDRNGNETDMSYDSAGRLTITIVAANNPTVSLTTSTSYLDGTVLPESILVGGNLTQYTYDQEHRVVATTQYPNGFTQLTASTKYDAFDRVFSTTDAHGYSTFNLYDQQDQITRSIHEMRPGALSEISSDQLAGLSRDASPNPAYVITDSLFDVDGELTSTIDGRGIATNATFDNQGRLVAQVFAAGTSSQARTEWAYDAQGNCIDTRWPRNFSEAGGFHSIKTYSGRNLLLSRTDAAGRPEQATFSMTYTVTGKPQSMTDARGNTTSYSYYACCDRLQTVTDPLGYQTNYTYDGVGNTTSVTDGNGLTSTTTFDARNREASITDAAGETTAFTYDDDCADGTGLAVQFQQITNFNFIDGSSGGSAKLTTDALGNGWLQIYDGIGRLVSTVDPNQNQTIWTFDQFAFLPILSINSETSNDYNVSNTIVLTSIYSDAMNNTWIDFLDGSSRKIAQFDPQHFLNTAAFDANANMLSQFDGTGVGYTASFDALNRCISKIDTNLDATSYGYDSAGNQILATDGLGKITQCVYDGLNRQVTTVDRLGNATTSVYDSVGNLTSVTDAESNSTIYAYDVRNLNISITYPDVNDTITYTYDGGKRQIGRLDQSGVLTTYVYDNANRVVSRDYPDSLNDTFQYNATGRLTSAKSCRYQNTVTESYDPAGRLIQESLKVPAGASKDPNVYSIEYAYDSDNRVASLTYPDGNVVSKSYYAKGLLQSVSYNGSSVAFFGYDDAGRETIRNWGNGINESRGYRPTDGMLTFLGIGVINSSNSFYTYDANKRITTEANASNDQQVFGYDAEGRITTWSRSNQDIRSWTLSPVGDWQQATMNGVSQSETHTATHEISSINSLILTSDAKGNQLTDGNGGAYTWDFENRLQTAITLGMSSSYAYDALGRRVQKTVNGLTTTYVSAQSQEIWEIDGYQSGLTANEANGGSPSTTLPLGGVLDGTSITRINFQPSTSTVPTGYDPDSGAAIGIQADGLTYGWVNGSQPYTNQYNLLPLPNFDTNDSMQFTETPDNSWQIQLPNGQYPVVVVMGDAAHRDMDNSVDINSQIGVDPAPDAFDEQATYEQGRFVGYAVTAEVTDGTLTISPDATAYNARICFIEIGQEGQSIDPTSQDRLAILVQSMTEATAGTAPQLQTRSHVFGSYVDEPIMSINQGVKYYLHHGRNYSILTVSDSNRNFVERYQYDAYGSRTVENSTFMPLSSTAIGQDWGYTGRRLDEETGLYFFRSRMYSPLTGGFLSRDPAGYINGLSQYLGYFVPMLLDPFGLDDEDGGTWAQRWAAAIAAATQEAKDFINDNVAVHAGAAGWITAGVANSVIQVVGSIPSGVLNTGTGTGNAYYNGDPNRDTFQAVIDVGTATANDVATVVSAPLLVPGVAKLAKVATATEADFSSAGKSLTQDPNLPAGTGTTSWTGDMVVSSQGTADEVATAVAHEGVHSALSSTTPWRAALKKDGYGSDALAAIEEAIAETRAAGLIAGIKYPFIAPYYQISKLRIAMEVAAYASWIKEAIHLAQEHAMLEKKKKPCP
jgi:RHS repeat-associated protein